MSVEYYVACHECRKILHVATDRMGGFSFYSGEPNCMRALRDMLADCIFHIDKLAFVREQGPEWDDYKQIEWSNKP